MGIFYLFNFFTFFLGSRHEGSFHNLKSFKKATSSPLSCKCARWCVKPDFSPPLTGNQTIFLFFYIDDCHFDPANMFVLHKMGCNCFHHAFARSLSLFFKCRKKKKNSHQKFYLQMQILQAIIFCILCYFSLSVWMCLSLPAKSGNSVAPL